MTDTSAGFLGTLLKVTGIKATPTMADLAKVEEEMGAIRIGISEGGRGTVALGYGAYIGEVVRSQVTACWTIETELPEAMRHGVPVLRVTKKDGGRFYAFTVSTAFQHLQNGAEDSPTFAVKVLMKDAKPAQ